jgi:ArsR family transcriptional regulator
MQALLPIFHALADPTRLRIFHLLKAMELSVGEIAQVIGQSQPRVSRHIRILAEAGLIERRREGSWVFLTPARNAGTTATLAWFDAVPAAEEERLWFAADVARLEAVRAERTRSAALYFAEHAQEWDAIRSLHAPERQVETAMLDLLGDRPIGRLLDIGTGTGRMVELFGPTADSVIALDRSAEMLRLARAKLAPEIGAKCQLMIGDFNDLALEAATADTVVLHQVLHYAQAPQHVVGEVARVLAPGGRVLIVDFAPHDREELRQRAAHARLGFSDDQISGWMRKSGIDHLAARSLVGDALTVKLWLGERRSASVHPLPTFKEQA